MQTRATRSRTHAPRGNAAAAVGTAPAPPTTRGFDLRVLVAETNPAVRRRLARLLTQAGYRVTCVVDGAAALDTLKADFHPLLLCDWDLPGLSGRSLVKTVRALEWPGYVYVVLFTGFGVREHAVEALAAGADDYVAKPVDEAELIARVATGRRVIELDRHLRAAERAALQAAVVDGLTGAYNRGCLLERLPEELHAARRFDHPVAVVMADLDHFKRVNDTWGHATGDRALRAFADALRRAVRREVDWLARYGGEEFVLVLPGATLAGALQVAEQCRAATEALHVQHDATPVPLTASFGVAVADPRGPGGLDAEHLLACADACLYRAKRRGRNRVVGPEALEA